MDWREMWKIVYDAVKQHDSDPEKYPLHENFWGYRRFFGQHPNEPFPEKVLETGPTPRLMCVAAAVGLAKGNLNRWLRRRVCYIRKIKTDPH